MRRILRWLWDEHGAQKLDRYVPKVESPHPRSVTATHEERRRLIEGAPVDLRLFILLCSDLGIRSGTAVNIAPRHYDQAEGTIRFKTKKDAKVGLHVTQEVRSLLDTCDQRDPRPFITQLRTGLRAKSQRQLKHEAVAARQLRTELKELRLRLGIERRVVPHDLRRTSAVNLYRLTRNLRQVQAFLGHSSMQSTIWYLDHDLEEVPLADLETIKTPFLAWRKDTKTA